MNKRCACGCGRFVKTGNTYLNGHNHPWKGHSHSEESKRKQSETRKRLYGKKEQERRLCACGCGELANPGRRFIKSHNMRNKIFSKETRIKLSIANTGQIRSDETRKALSLALEGNHNHRGHSQSKIARKRMSRTIRLSLKPGKKWIKWHPFLLSCDLSRIKNLVKHRDTICVRCGSLVDKFRFIIHHIVPVKVGFRSDLCDHESNLVLLCRACHSSVEAYKKGKDSWKGFLEQAYNYLKRFGYPRMLLLDYYVPSDRNLKEM